MNMRIAVITQEDRFVIPDNIEKILALPGIETSLICTVDAPGALEQKKMFFWRGFGACQTLRMGLRWINAKFADLADSLCGYRLLRRKHSIRAVARKHGIPFETIRNPNNEVFLNRLRAMDVELVVSLSAPCVFKPPLLELPRLGCINLHCSLLPRYAGLLPSFWVLYYGESISGATVHYMDSKIDNGAILGQVKVPIQPGTSVFDLIRQTKSAGGDLMVGIIQSLQRGEIQAQPNRAEEGSYFSWPTVEQMREFRRRGGLFA
jgi:methionyl-tRNA formyltransferase